MALKGFFGGQETTTSESSPNRNEKSGFYGEPEGAGTRKMNRIDKPRSGSIVSVGRDTDADSVSVGKQVEMEATNAIKYRTCSWPKVRLIARYVSLF